MYVKNYDSSNFACNSRFILHLYSKEGKELGSSFRQRLIGQGTAVTVLKFTAGI